MKLKIGDTAPRFVGKDQNGNDLSLQDYMDKKLVLYFYPRDNTPGCTKQGCNLRDNYQELIKKGYEVVGVNADSSEKHKKFIEKNNFPFSLIADTDYTIQEQYDTWGQKSFLGTKYWGTQRTTFIIEKGKIVDIIEKVNIEDHTSQIIK